MQTLSLLVGTYTANTGSGGVYRLRIENGKALTPEKVLQTQDPSYLLRSQNNLYWVNEALDSPTGQVGFATRTRNAYSMHSVVSSCGENPCHLAVSPQGEWLAAANYTSGEISVYSLSSAGIPTLAKVFPGSRTGPNTTRQERPHAHFVIFLSESELICCDLGGDCLRRIMHDGSCWSETEPFAILPAGCGPRHLVAGKSYLYVLCELTSELLTVSRADRLLVHRMSILPAAVSGSAAAIHFSDDGRLFASHRGGDCISVFSLAEPEKPVLTDVIDCCGQSPRDFLPIEGGLICACQNSNTLTIFRETQGGYVLEQKVHVPCPVCLIEE